MNKIVLVGLGGALGAILRYTLSLVPLKGDFPLITFSTNMIGAMVIGFVVGVFEKEMISDAWLLFLKTGVCGGFTTFSTFSLETIQLLESGKLFIGIIYIFISIIGCLLGVIIGRYLSMR